MLLEGLEELSNLLLKDDEFLIFLRGIGLMLNKSILDLRSLLLK